MGKHTEGRWEASVTQEFGCEVKANGEDIAWVLSNKPEDAHLMAASPELLEALEMLETTCELGLGYDHAIRQVARAAIAKARGEA